MFGQDLAMLLLMPILLGIYLPEKGIPCDIAYCVLVCASMCVSVVVVCPVFLHSIFLIPYIKQ